MICRRMRAEYKILEIVTRTLRPTKVHHARRINKDSQSTTSDVKKLKKFNKNVSVLTFLRQKLSILAFFLTLYVRVCCEVWTVNLN